MMYTETKMREIGSDMAAQCPQHNIIDLYNNICP